MNYYRSSRALASQIIASNIETSDRPEILINMEQVNTNTRRASKRKQPLMLDRLNIDHGKDRPAKRSKIETIKAREESEHPILTTDADVYCWVCHKNASQNKFKCTSCYKVYHPKCYDAELTTVKRNWICPQCILIKYAESPEKLKPDPIDLNELLYYSLKRLKLYPAYKELLHPVDTNEHVDYLDYVLTPMDLGTIENKIKTHSYTSTESFLLDLKYLLHNSYIYNSSSSELTKSARQMLRIARQECDEIENCSECYKNAHIMPNNLWFIEPCTRPHLLVWAKLKGYPYWPGKLIRVIDDQADIRFFGDHNRSMIPISQVFLFSPQMPVPSSSSFKNLRSAIIEIEKHIEKLKQVHGTFEYAPNNVQYDPERELDQIKLHLTNYNLHIPRKAATPGVLTLKKPIKKASTRKTKSNSNIKTKGKNEKKSIDTKETEVEVNATSIDVVVSNAPVDQNNITNEETPRILNIAPVKKSSRGRKKSSLKSSSGKKSLKKITADTSTLNQNAATNIISTKMDTSTQVQNATSNVISSEIDTNTQVQNATANIISTEKDTGTQVQNVTSNISAEMDTNTQVQNATSNIISTEIDTSTQVQNVTSNISTEMDTDTQDRNEDTNIEYTVIETIKKHSITNEESVETKEGKTLGIEIIDITENQVEKVVLPPAETPNMNSETSVFMNHLNSEVAYFPIPKVISQANTPLKNPPKSTPLSLNIEEESKKTESLTITKMVPEYNIALTANPFYEKNNEITPTEIHKETLSKPETTAHKPETTAHKPEIGFKLRKLTNKNQEVQQIINQEQIVPRNEFKVPNLITKMPLSLTSKMNGSLLTNSNNKVPDIPKPPTHTGIRSDSHLHTKHGLYEIKTESELSSRQGDTESYESQTVSNNSCMLENPIPKPSLHPETVRSDSQLNNHGLLVIKTESELSSPQDDTESCELSSPQSNIESGEFQALQESNSFSMLLTHKEMLAVQPKPSLKSVIVSPKTEPQTTISVPTEECEIRTITTDDVLASMRCATTTKEMLSIVEREFDDVKNFYESRLTSITDTCATQIEECDQKVKDGIEKCDKKINKITTEYEAKLKNQKEFYEKQIQELNKKIEDTKKKMWCKWCLSEAKFMCCPDAYYCSTRCKQYDEVHPKICSNENLVLLRNSESRSLKIVMRKPDASDMINLQANNTIQENVAVQNQSNTKLFRSLPLGKKYIILNPEALANPRTMLNVRFVPTSQPKVFKEAKKATGSTAYSNVKTTGYDRPSMVNTLKNIDLPGTSKSQHLQKKKFSNFTRSNDSKSHS